MTDEDIIFRLRHPMWIYEVNKHPELSPEHTVQDMNTAADRIAALLAEHAEDQSVIAVWRGRTERAEAERDAAVTLLREWLHKYGDDGDSSGRQLNEKTRAVLLKEGAR